MRLIVSSVFGIAAMCVFFAVNPHPFRTAHIFAVAAMHPPVDLRCLTPMCAVVAPHGHRQ